MRDDAEQMERVRIAGLRRQHAPIASLGLGQPPRLEMSKAGFKTVRGGPKRTCPPRLRTDLALLAIHRRNPRGTDLLVTKSPKAQSPN